MAAGTPDERAPSRWQLAEPVALDEFTVFGMEMDYFFSRMNALWRTARRRQHRTSAAALLKRRSRYSTGRMPLVRPHAPKTWVAVTHCEPDRPELRARALAGSPCATHLACRRACRRLRVKLRWTLPAACIPTVYVLL